MPVNSRDAISDELDTALVRMMKRVNWCMRIDPDTGPSDSAMVKIADTLLHINDRVPHVCVSAELERGRRRSVSHA